MKILTERLLGKMSLYNDRKSISEYLLVNILDELIAINKKFEKPKVKRAKRKKAKK